MSLFDKYLAGWQLRTTKPRLEPGTEVTLVVTDYDNEADAAVARVGDTRIRIEDTSSDIVDMRVRVEITDFDDNDHAGTAELVEVVGETMY
jgi:hypothetical protein